MGNVPRQLLEKQKNEKAKSVNSQKRQRKGQSCLHIPSPRGKGATVKCLSGPEEAERDACREDPKPSSDRPNQREMRKSPGGSPRALVGISAERFE